MAGRRKYPLEVIDQALDYWHQHDFATAHKYLYSLGYQMPEAYLKDLIKKRDKLRWPDDHTKRRWSIRDRAYLQHHYGKGNTDEIAAHLNRTPTAVRLQASLAGLTRETTPIQAWRVGDRRETITEPLIVYHPDRNYGPFIERIQRLLRAWKATWIAPVVPYDQKWVINDQWLVVPEGGTFLPELLVRHVHGITFGWDLDVRWLYKLRRWAITLTPESAVVLVPLRDRTVHYLLTQDTDIEALVRLYGPATRLSKKRTVENPWPRVGKMRKQTDGFGIHEELQRQQEQVRDSARPETSCNFREWPLSSYCSTHGGFHYQSPATTPHRLEAPEGSPLGAASGSPDRIPGHAETEA